MNIAAMIEVFKTNVEEKTDAGLLVDILKKQFPCSRINFDLWDHDKILRIEGADFKTQKVIEIVEARGFNCSILES